MVTANQKSKIDTHTQKQGNVSFIIRVKHGTYSNQITSEELLSILLKLFLKVAEEGASPNSSYEVSITLIPKSDKDATGKENYRLIPMMNISIHILNKTLANQIQHHYQVGYSPGMQGCFNICKSIKMIYHTNKLKNKNHIIIDRCRKGIVRIQYLMIKKLNKVDLEETIPQYNKGYVQQTHS